jgi:predicted phage baseplate assembly protein
VDESAVDQSALQHVTIGAQPAPLQLLPQPLGDADYPVSGNAIELDSLIAGMAPGRLIIVRGVRTDLPAGATVVTGELAMVESITSSASGGDTTHSTLNLAQPLAYAYTRSTVQIFGNVVPALQGATLHEVLGSGQPAVPHQTFTLASGPPLADAAANSGGFQSTLTVTVDGVGYQEVDRFDATTPSRSFMTGTDPRGATTITFAAPLPAGSGNVRASYRAGNGSQGNVRADQVTQLLTRPSGLASVTNPLPGDGGAAGDGPEDVRAATPIGLRGLGRIVTVQDCGDLASSWAGVGKALATPAQVAGMDGVLITVAGINPEPLPAGDGIAAAIEAAISDEADPQLPVVVVPADLYLIVLQAAVVRDPLVDWDTTADAVRAALLAAFGYASRGLGQDVALSDLIAAAHGAPSVLSFAVEALALVPATVTPGTLAQRLPSLLAAAPPPVFTLQAAATEWGIAPPAGQPAPAAVAYLSDAAPDTLILREQTS